MTEATEKVDVPRVTIAMPVYNTRHTIGAAIQSIRMQTFENWELLIFDDGSSDGTVEVAKTFHDPRIVIWKDQQRRGIAARLNEAIEKARGTYFARMDGDDIAYPERLALQIEILDNQPDLDLVAGSVVKFDEQGRIRGVIRVPSTHEQICAHAWSGFHMPHPSWMGRTEWFRCHKYNLDMPPIEDQELLLRAMIGSRYAGITDILLGYRITGATLRKRLYRRWRFAQTFLNHFSAQHMPLLGIRSASLQFLKSIYDIFTIPTGIEQLLKGLHSSPVSCSEKHKWEQTWQSVQDNKLSNIKV